MSNSPEIVADKGDGPSSLCHRVVILICYNESRIRRRRIASAGVIT